MASNLRVLVSNIDGNWGYWDYSAVPPALDTENQLTGSANVYFPPGSSKGVVPKESEMFFSTDYSSWTSKSNWIIQLNGNFGTGEVDVYVGRPTGIEELVLKGVGENFSWGGCSSIDFTAPTPVDVYENITGPITYFRFNSRTAVTSVNCYVIGWNEGDICDGVAKLA